MLHSLISISYTLILQAVFRLPSQDGRHKSQYLWFPDWSHSPLLYPILIYFSDSLLWQNIPHHIHFLLANLYVLISPMLNPIIYGAKIKQIRDSMSHMLSIVGKS